VRELHDSPDQERPADEHGGRDRRDDRDEDGVDADEIAEDPDREQELPVADALRA
jgi:hypothetical protein